MGKSVMCTFKVKVLVSNGGQQESGAMTLNDVRGLILSEKEYQEPKGNKVVYAKIIPQTARGKNLLKKDFAIMAANDFTIDHYYTTDKIPMYCF